MTAPISPSHGPALLAQALSAWMDGEALPDGVEEDALLKWATQDAQASGAWRDWHLARDVMRQGHAGSQMELALPVESSRWMAKMQQALAATAVASEQQDVLGDFPEADQVMREYRPKRFDTTRPSANEGVWRWKLAAGFASVAAAGLLGWNVLALQSQSAGMALIAQAPVMQTDEALQDRATGVPTAAGPVAMSATEQADPDLQELLVAHAQVGGQSLLPELTVTAADME